MGALAAVIAPSKPPGSGGWEPAVLLKVQILQQAGAHTGGPCVLEAEARARRRAPVAAPGEGACAGERPARHHAASPVAEASPQIPSRFMRWACCRCSSRTSPRPSCIFARALATEHPQPDLHPLTCQTSPTGGEGERARWFGEIESEDSVPSKVDIRSAPEPAH